MKKLLLSLICVIAAGQLFAQQSSEIKQTLRYEPKKQSIGDISVGYGCLTPDGNIASFINLGYAAYLSPNFSLGGTFSWNTSKINNQFTGLINAKYNWYNIKYLSLYSRLGVGLTSYNSISTGMNTINISNNTDVALQVTLFGVEAGKGYLRFYTEVGLGTTGCFEFGLRLKL